MKLLALIPWVIGRVVHGGESSIRPVDWARTSGFQHGIPRIASLVVALLLWSAGIGLAQTVDTTLWVTNGPVRSVASDGSTIYIAGDFTRVSPATGGWVAIDASTAAVQLPYPKLAGTVYAVAPDGSGGWYLGGQFTAVRGQPRKNLAHLDAGGNLTAWDPSASSGPTPRDDVFTSVNALVVSGGTVYAGGNFTSIGGRPRNNIAALDATTGAVRAWNANASGSVYTLAVSGSTVYAGGTFTSIGGQTRYAIAALDAGTAAATAWSANAVLYQGLYAAVIALAVSGGTVYAAGRFDYVGGQLRSNIAALDATTGAVTAWSPNANYTVYSLAVSGGTIYAGGGFTSIGGQLRNYIAALDATTGAATAWDPNANDYVQALALSGGTVYAGGNFSTIGGQARNYIAALDATTGAATAWNPNATLNGAVFAVAVSGGTVYAGGGFTGVGGQPRNFIAALDAATGAATAWNPNANQRVFALAVSGGTVYVGGPFTSIGGQPRNQIAALDAATGAATAWNPNPSGGVSVSVLAVSGSTVYAGGDFTSIGGQPRNAIAALDAATGAATAWNPNANGYVLALVVSASTIYASGGFASIGGQPRNRIAALDAATGAATAWNPNARGGTYDAVNALAVSGGTVYAGGTFFNIGAQPRNNIAALDATTGAATAWNPNADYAVNALALSGGTVYAGGFFINIGAQPRNNIAALDAATGAATAWNPNAGGPGGHGVNALAVSSGTVYAGGYFTSIGGQPQSGIVATADGSLIPVTVQIPNGNERLLIGDVVNLFWTASSSAPVNSIDVLLSRSGSAGPFSSLATGLPNTSSYAWVVTGPATSAAVLKVIAHDATARTGSDLSDMTFTIADPTVADGGPVTQFVLSPVWPDPVQGSPALRFALPEPSRVRLSVIDLQGREVAVVAEGEFAAGRHEIRLPAGRRDLVPGLYFARLRVAGHTLVLRFVVTH